MGVTATVVRPYRESIRKRVFELLASVNVHCSLEQAIAVGTPDGEAAARVLELGRKLLLVPFNAHRDRNGALVSGVTLLTELLRRDPNFEFRVVMPVSEVGGGGLALLMDPIHTGRRPPIEVFERTLVIREHELDCEKLRDKLVSHCAPLLPAA